MRFTRVPSWTSVSLKATPPPQSVRVSLVRPFGDHPVGMLVAPPAPRDRGHARPQPAAMRTGSSTEERSLNTSARSPSASPRHRGVGGVELDERGALGRPVLGQVRVAGVEEARVVLGCHQLQREAPDRAGSPSADGTYVGSAGSPITPDCR